MPLICTVRIPLPLETVQKIEKDNPEILNLIRASARQYMQGHSRYASANEVLDIDQYESREQFDAFMSEAGTAIKDFGRVLGTQPRDEVWEVIQP